MFNVLSRLPAFLPSTLASVRRLWSRLQHTAERDARWNAIWLLLGRRVRCLIARGLDCPE